MTTLSCGPVNASTAAFCAIEFGFYVFVDASEVLGKKYKDTVVESVAQMAEILINDYNTAVVPCADFGFEKHLRLSYAISIEQIEKGLDRIESFLNDLK